MVEKEMSENHRLFRKKTFNSLWYLIFMIYFCLGILPVIIDNLLVNLHGSTKFGIGLTAASNLITISLSLVFFGYFEDKIVEKNLRKKVFLITNLIWVVAYGLVSLSPNFLFYMLFIIIGAIGIGAFVPIGYSIIGDYYPPKKRGKKYSSIHVGLILGTGVGIIVGGLLSQYAGSNGWRFAYAMGFGFGVLTIINFILKSVDPKRAQAEPEFKSLEGEFSYSYKIDIKRLGGLFKKRTVASILIYTLISGIAVSTIGSWGIFYLTSKFGEVYSEISATTLYLLTGVGILPGAILGGKLGDSFYYSGRIRGRVVLTLLGLILGIICLMIFYLLPISVALGLEIVFSWFLLLTIGFLGYFLVSLSIGNVFAIYSEVCAPEIRSTINAFNQVMRNIGGVVGNLVFTGLIEYDISLLPYAMFLLLLFWLIGTSFWIITYKFYPNEFKECRELMSKRSRELTKNMA
jgi:MFS family permease